MNLCRHTLFRSIGLKSWQRHWMKLLSGRRRKGEELAWSHSALIKWLNADKKHKGSGCSVRSRSSSFMTGLIRWAFKCNWLSRRCSSSRWMQRGGLPDWTRFKRSIWNKLRRSSGRLKKAWIMLKSKVGFKAWRWLKSIWDLDRWIRWWQSVKLSVRA
jgi:hypothetical protein